MPPKARRPEGQVCDLTQERGVKIYHEFSGPNKSEWQGEKEAVLFLLLGSVSDLRKTADQQYINQTCPFFKVLTYDHRNTGQSTKKDEPCTMEDYADDAAALLQAVVPERLPVYVLGVSFGGMVAQHLAIRHPHLIRKLVLCCCATGGEGGRSFPIHELYAPGTTVEERVTRKIFLANTDRTPEWKVTHDTEWQMSLALLSRDEKVGKEDPLTAEGAARQLEARAAHDTWDTIGKLAELPVLVAGSHKDNLTPPAILQNLVKRIGNCDSKLDFDWGHPFIAADITAMPYINEWLRKEGGAKVPAASSTPAAIAQVWKVVGGSDKGGIIARAGEGTSSQQLEPRLSTGALIQELEMKGDRLNYKLLKGDGPSTGWVAIKLKDGKELAVKTDEKP